MTQPDNRSRRHFLKVSSMFGLATAFYARTIRDAFADSKLASKRKENSMTQTTATQQSEKTAIRPFQFNFPDAELADLRRRITATRWPERCLRITGSTARVTFIGPIRFVASCCSTCAGDISSK